MKLQTNESPSTEPGETPRPNPYKDRKGSEQGEPLTETEIQEGIEDEPGTLGDVEIDEDLFSDPSLGGTSCTC